MNTHLTVHIIVDADHKRIMRLATAAHEEIMDKARPAFNVALHKAKVALSMTNDRTAFIEAVAKANDALKADEAKAWAPYDKARTKATFKDKEVIASGYNGC